MMHNNLEILHVPTTDIVIGILPIVGKGREAERFAVKSLLRKLLQVDVKIAHNEDGKPLVEGYNISISHTQGWAAVILSKTYKVGIDIEYQSERIQKIAKRFLRADEPFTQTSDILYAWCAKESLYKLRSVLHLGYQEMKVDPQAATIYDLRSNNSLSVSLRSVEEYLLTYVWE